MNITKSPEELKLLLKSSKGKYVFINDSGLLVFSHIKSTSSFGWGFKSISFRELIDMIDFCGKSAIGKSISEMNYGICSLEEGNRMLNEDQKMTPHTNYSGNATSMWEKRCNQK